MDRLLLVDGSNLLFQMFFGMPARIINAQGKAIQGTLGFVGALLKIIRRVRPTHVAVLFDGEHENERVALDETYKSNRIDYSRVEEEDSPFSQLPDVYAALDFLKIRHAETEECETDDWMAGYALEYGGQAEVVIASFDSDFFQLLNDKVSVLRYRGERTQVCTPEFLREKWGISPEQYADFKSLTGDPSDNIKGADKIGPKTAAELLQKFGSLEGILCRVEEISKPSVRASLLQSADRLRVNYQMIKLTGCGKLPFALSALEFEDGGWSTTEVLREIGLR